jgi:hypothetical protein
MTTKFDNDSFSRLSEFVEAISKATEQLKSFSRGLENLCSIRELGTDIMQELFFNAAQ